MLQVGIAVRAAVVVFGISALALLGNRIVNDSGIQQFFLMRQQSTVVAIWCASAIQNLTYGLLVLTIGLLIVQRYNKSLLPQKYNSLGFLVCLVGGALFSMFLNQPIHSVLFELYYGKPNFTGGMVSDTIAAGLFNGLQGLGKLFSLSAFATVFLSPLAEEFTDRGILFKEAEQLPLWKVAALSLFVFCVSHYAIGGVPKVLAVAPAAALFIALRLKFGSFAYSAAAHMGVNLAALLDWQIF